MLELFYLIGFIIIFGVVVALFPRKKWKTPTSTPADKHVITAYALAKGVFVNASEKTFYQILRRHQKHGYHIYPKVRLEDIIGVGAHIKDPKLRWQYRGRVKSRHVDFVICDDQGRYIVAIELDGSAHRNEQSKMVDGFKNAIFSHVGLPLYRVRTGEDFNRFCQGFWTELER